MVGSFKTVSKVSIKKNNIVETVHLQLTQAEETVKIPWEYFLGHPIVKNPIHPRIG